MKRANRIANVAHVKHHADELRNLSRLRGMVVAADEFREAILSRGAKADEVVAALEASVLTLRHGAATDASPIGALWDDVIAEYEAQLSSGERRIILSGLPTLDDLGFVFAPGELAVLAARPGVGKTALALQVGMHHATKGRAVLFVSLEMKGKELGSRVLLPAAELNHHWLRTGKVDAQAIAQMKTARAELGAPPLFVWSPGRVKAGIIHAAASVLKASSDIKMLIVDYIGLVRPDDPGRQRYEQIGEIVKALRGIGQHLEIPVLALCQLNREGEKDNKRPRLSNLRESGDIEQDADLVAFLHPTAENRVDLILEKNRQGARGYRNLQWLPEHTRFDDSASSKPNYDRSMEDFNNRQGPTQQEAF
jgi:replicative DNA helicase